MTGPPGRAVHPATLAAAAAVAIAMAVGISEGLYDPVSLALVTGAAVLVAFALAGSPKGEAVATRWPPVVLGAGLALALGFDAAFLPGMLVDPARLGAFRPLLGALALLCATQLWRNAPEVFRRLRFQLLVLGWLVLAAVVVRASPAPGIDVWRLQQAGATALRDGHDPYAVAYPNPYGPATTILAPEVLSPDRRFIVAFPYTPLTAVLGVPAAALGDVRWTYLLATAAAAVLVHLLGGRSQTAELAASFLLLQPRTLMVMEVSWTEPLVLASVAGVALLASRAARERRGASLARGAAPGGAAALGIAAGLALASKQYVPLLLVPFWPVVPVTVRGRALAIAAAVAAAIYLPFVLWDPAALWRGVVGFQLAQPFRPDALSWAAAVVSWGGPQLPTWPSFVLAGGAAVAGALRARSTATALVAAALAFLLLVVTNKQAFANYYWLSVGLLCAAVAASVEPPRASRT